MTLALKLDKPEYNLGDTIKATITYTNDGKAAVKVPKPEFCLPSTSFRLYRNPDAKTPISILTRVGPEAATVKVDPGQSISGTIELAAIEAHGLNIEALFNPQGRITPTLEGAQVETSKRVALKVHANGKKLRVKLDTEAGPIVLEFYPDRAHNHVLSFVQLAQRGYYNGISFHRIVPTFVIQGGDPTGTGGGGPGYKLPAEFNEILHDDGILSMARTPDPHSAGSQFFVCLSRERTKSLDNQYTVFGKVVEGLEAVHVIGANEANARRYHMKKAEVVLV